MYSDFCLFPLEFVLKYLIKEESPVSSSFVYFLSDLSPHQLVNVRDLRNVLWWGWEHRVDGQKDITARGVCRELTRPAGRIGPGRQVRDGKAAALLALV